LALVQVNAAGAVRSSRISNFKWTNFRRAAFRRLPFFTKSRNHENISDASLKKEKRIVNAS
jgi:hypothetical protein